ncbi:hypothetical protein JCM16358_13070 [Halanaerocella petrolearia]
MRKLIVTILFLITIFPNPVASKSNSSYFYRMEIGEHISEIDHGFQLDYQGDIADYRFRGQIDLDKNYRFLKGIKREDKWEYSDYYISIAKDDTKLEAGLVDPEATSSFVYTGQIEGLYLQWANYQLWQGYLAEESSGFGSNSQQQYGLSYQGQEKEFTYQSIQERESVNHFVSYNDQFLIDKYYLLSNISLGTETGRNLTGIASELNLNSNWGRFNYDVTLEYKSPDFEAVTSMFDKGYGRYKTRLYGYRKLGPTLISSKLKYSENNLNEEADDIDKDWSSNLRLEYYAGLDTTYTTALSFSRDNEYRTEDRFQTDKDERTSFKLGYEKGDFDCDLSWIHTRDYGLLNDKGSSEDDFAASFSYDRGSYQVEGSYQLDKLNADEDKDEDEYNKKLNLSLDYDHQISENTDYSLGTEISKGEEWEVDLNQNINYYITKKQEINLQLNLSKYLDGSKLDKKLIINYQYQF